MPAKSIAIVRNYSEWINLHLASFLKWFCVAIKYGNLQFYKVHILPIVLKVSSTSPLLFSFVSFFGDGGRSASFFPFFFPGDFERFPADGLRPDFFPLSSFFSSFRSFGSLLKMSEKSLNYK